VETSLRAPQVLTTVRRCPEVLMMIGLEQLSPPLSADAQTEHPSGEQPA
jgi:hypothetical protein